MCYTHYWYATEMAKFNIFTMIYTSNIWYSNECAGINHLIVTGSVDYSRVSLAVPCMHKNGCYDITSVAFGLTCSDSDLLNVYVGLYLAYGLVHWQFQLIWNAVGTWLSGSTDIIGHVYSVMWTHSGGWSFIVVPDSLHSVHLYTLNYI